MCGQGRRGEESRGMGRGGEGREVGKRRREWKGRRKERWEGEGKEEGEEFYLFLLYASFSL